MLAIHTKVLPATLNHGTRIKVMCEGFNSVTVPYDGFGESAHKNAVSEFIKRHKLNWSVEDMAIGQLPDGTWAFVDAEADRKKCAQMEERLRELLQYIVTGDHYETKNPYRREPVVKALQTLSNWHGGDWIDQLKAKGQNHA